jgi:3-oxoacyl-(acyl-carrier-protein) synthase
MRVLCRGFNDEPEKASRPLSASAGGFVPGAGAGVLVLESLACAEERGARIYAEVLGSAINCGGHRGGGSMTAPNPTGVRRVIREALADAGIEGRDVDLVNGHLTATGADPSEVASWSEALGRGPGAFPTLTATKSLVGHTLGAAGAIESVATVLMLARRFAHPCLNSEDLHPAIEPFAASIPREERALPDARIAVKAGFGFGDVNACVVFRSWNS